LKIGAVGENRDAVGKYCDVGDQKLVVVAAGILKVDLLDVDLDNVDKRRTVVVKMAVDLNYAVADDVAVALRYEKMGIKKLSFCFENMY
jgi:hypothetical protein